MPLRNKKTGEIKSIGEIISEAFLYNDLDSLKTIDANWEDYKPKEPLIKDPKIRKAVRAWAEACNVDRCNYDGNSFATKWYGIMLDDSGEAIKSGIYTIEELCGEEEE